MNILVSVGADPAPSSLPDDAYTGNTVPKNREQAFRNRNTKYARLLWLAGCVEFLTPFDLKAEGAFKTGDDKPGIPGVEKLIDCTCHGNTPIEIPVERAS